MQITIYSYNQPLNAKSTNYTNNKVQLFNVQVPNKIIPINVQLGNNL